MYTHTHTHIHIHTHTHNTHTHHVNNVRACFTMYRDTTKRLVTQKYTYATPSSRPNPSLACSQKETTALCRVEVVSAVLTLSKLETKSLYKYHKESIAPLVMAVQCKQKTSGSV